jgi:zinc/manganese transport system substrate-binding protein/manganese/iron transport system substrate-binding protein
MPLSRAAFSAALATCWLILAASGPTRAAETPTLRVVTTISTFNSFVIGVGGARVRVESLVPLGAGPEDYQPTPRDVARIHDADILVQNGAGLEGWLARTIENAMNPRLLIVTCSDGLPLRNGNPHLWLDPVFARAYVMKIRDALSERDPAHRAEYETNARRYDARLRALEGEIARRIATIPPEQRTMIVFHSAWDYYSARFGLRIVGAIERSPGQEPNPRDLSDLVTEAKRLHVRAVFAEPEYSQKLAHALAESAQISTVATLYDDSVGSDPRVSDYVGMMRYDTETIVRALGGKPPAGSTW